MKDEESNFKSMKKLTPSQIKNMHPITLSKFLAYSEPPKNAMDGQNAVIKRLRDRKKAFERNIVEKSPEEIHEEQKHAKLIGQLKAAESRTRLRIMRLKYEANKLEEINHLVACQPSALSAVRLHALVPSKQRKFDNTDKLDKVERSRVEALMDDQRGLIVNRIR